MAEPVASSNVGFAANGGTTPGYLSRPEAQGSYPGIVLIQEWWGVDDHIVDVTRRFAARGMPPLRRTSSMARSPRSPRRR